MNRKQILAAVRAVLDDARIAYRVNYPRRGSIAICLELKIKGPIGRVQEIFEFRKTFVRMYAFAYDMPKAADFDGMLLCVAKANIAMSAGCFELELGSGGLCFRHFIDFAGFASIPRDLVLRTVMLPAQMFAHHSNALVAAAKEASAKGTGFAKPQKRAKLDVAPKLPATDTDDLFSAVTRFLDGIHVPHRVENSRRPPAVIAPEIEVGGACGPVSLVAEIRDARLLVYASASFRANPKHLGELAKFLAAVNRNLLPGNFDLDVDTGEIRYRLSLETEGFAPRSDALLHRSLMVPLLVFRQYGNALSSLAKGLSDAATALTEI